MLCVTGGDNMDFTFQSSVTIHTGFTNLTDLQLINDSSTRKWLQHYINMFSNFSTLRNNLFVWFFFLFLWLLLQETLNFQPVIVFFKPKNSRWKGGREPGTCYYLGFHIKLQGCSFYWANWWIFDWKIPFSASIYLYIAIFWIWGLMFPGDWNLWENTGEE